MHLQMLVSRPLYVSVRYLENASFEAEYGLKLAILCGLMLVRVEAGHGTTREAGYDVGQGGGRPHSTTQEAGYDVGQIGGRPHSGATLFYRVVCLHSDRFITVTVEQHFFTVWSASTLTNIIASLWLYENQNSPSAEF